VSGHDTKRGLVVIITVRLIERLIVIMIIIIIFGEVRARWRKVCARLTHAQG
jgi:hypothetical protein